MQIHVASHSFRIIAIFYRNLHEQAVLYCVCASLIELTRETSRVDVLRAVNSGGTVVGKIINSLVSNCYSLFIAHVVESYLNVPL